MQADRFIELTKPFVTRIGKEIHCEQLIKSEIQFISLCEMIDLTPSGKKKIVWRRLSCR